MSRIKSWWNKVSTGRVDLHDLFMILIGLAILLAIFAWMANGFPLPEVSFKGISLWWIILLIVAGLIIWSVWPKKGESWKWSKIWNNTGMVATVILFAAGAWFLVVKSRQTVEAATEPFADVRALREERFKERQALYTKSPVPHNFKLKEWATYHKDSTYRYTRGMNVDLLYQTTDPDVTVTYTKVSNSNVGTKSWDQNGTPRKDLTADDHVGNTEWYFRVSKTAQMYWWDE